MKKFTVGNYELEFDASFVERFEDVTGSFLEDCIESFIKTGFGVWSVDEAFNNHSVQEITQKITRMMENDIEAYSGLL